MVRVRAPLFSLSARGWLGKYSYGRMGVVRQPYPIDFFSFRYGIILWRGTWSDEKISWAATNWTWDGLKPDIPRAFLSFYYSPLGWCYQRRRTWHGIIWSAIRPPISANPKTPAQVIRQTKFANAILAWQAMNQNTKDYYKKLRYPVHASGYNRFISFFMKDKPC